MSGQPIQNKVLVAHPLRRRDFIRQYGDEGFVLSGLVLLVSLDGALSALVMVLDQL